MKKAIQLICVLLVAAMLAVPVCAADFTPSVEQKGAPAAAEAGVAVTALADLDTAPAEVRKAVEKAYAAITEKGLAEIPAVKAAAVGVKVEDLVVRDLFYVAADQPLADGEEKVITFQVQGIKAADFLMVMVFVDGEWIVLDAEKVEITGDGEVKIAFPVLGPVAFVTAK